MINESKLQLAYIRDNLVTSTYFQVEEIPEPRDHYRDPINLINKILDNKSKFELPMQPENSSSIYYIFNVPSIYNTSNTADSADIKYINSSFIINRTKSSDNAIDSDLFIFDWVKYTVTRLDLSISKTTLKAVTKLNYLLYSQRHLPQLDIPQVLRDLILTYF